jgi:hypothetical protein
VARFDDRDTHRDAPGSGNRPAIGGAWTVGLVSGTNMEAGFLGSPLDGRVSPRVSGG